MVLSLIVGVACSPVESAPFSMSRELTEVETDYLRALDNFAQVPADLEDTVVILGWEACSQLTEGTNEAALARAYEDVGWSPSPNEWIAILGAAGVTLCPEWAGGSPPTNTTTEPDSILRPSIGMIQLATEGVLTLNALPWDWYSGEWAGDDERILFVAWWVFDADAWAQLSKDDPVATISKPLEVLAESLILAGVAEEDLDLAILALNDPFGTAIEVEASDLFRYTNRMLTLDELLDRIVITANADS